MKDIAPAAPDCRVASLLLAVAAAMGDSTADVPPQETIYVNNLNEKLNKDEVGAAREPCCAPAARGAKGAPAQSSQSAVARNRKYESTHGCITKLLSH